MLQAAGNRRRTSCPRLLVLQSIPRPTYRRRQRVGSQIPSSPEAQNKWIGASFHLTEETMNATDRFVSKLKAYRQSRGVYAAAQALRRQGLSLKAALVLLAHAYQSERQA